MAFCMSHSVMWFMSTHISEKLAAFFFGVDENAVVNFPETCIYLPDNVSSCVRDIL
jgi:hypothetical protein